MQGLIFFNYLIDFSYFPLIKIFWKLQAMVITGQKLPFWKGVLMVSAIFIDFLVIRILPEIKLILLVLVQNRNHHQCT